MKDKLNQPGARYHSFPLRKTEFLSEFEKDKPIAFNVTKKQVLLMFSRHTVQGLSRSDDRSEDCFFYRDSHVWIYNNMKYFVFHIHPRVEGYQSVCCPHFPDVKIHFKNMVFI